MKTVSKKLFSLLLVAVLLLSAVPFQAFADPTYCKNDSHAAAEGYGSNADKHYTYCSVCAPGTIKYGSGEPHTWDAGTVTTEPTCTTDGEKTYTCTVCERTKTEPVPAAHVDKDGNKFCDSCGASLLGNDALTPDGTLKLDANGGHVSASVINTINGKALNTFGALPTPTREGYTFKGWHLGSETGKSISGATVCDWTGEQTAVAVWELNTKNLTVKVVFDDGSVAVQTIYDKPVTEGTPLLQFLLHNNEIQKRIKDYRDQYLGYTWYESYFYDYSGTQKLTSQDQKLDQAQTVYIRFSANKYVVSFDPAGGTCSTETKEVTYNKAVGTLPTPKRDGWVFTGWVDESDGNTIYTSETIYRLTRPTTLTAHWSQQAVVVLNIYLNGDTSKVYSQLELSGYSVFNDLSGKYDYVTRATVQKLITDRFAAQSGKTLAIDGLYTSATWADYVKNSSKAGTETIQINDVDAVNHKIYIYVMVRNAVPSLSGSNGSTSKPADPSNPKTGDNAFIVPAVCVMTMAAAAFVTVAAMRKKKMF